MLNVRFMAQVLVLGSTLLLGGCFVTAANRPIQQGPVNDESIVGDWRGVEESSGEEQDAFIHIQRPDENAPLRVVFVEGKDYGVYEMTTTTAGNRKVFALRGLAPEDTVKETGNEYMLGYYETRGNELFFYPLDSETVSNLIRAGKLAGVPGAKTYDSARLTGSPADLTRFLASDEGWAARIGDASRMRRIKTGN